MKAAVQKPRLSIQIPDLAHAEHSEHAKQLGQLQEAGAEDITRDVERLHIHPRLESLAPSPIDQEQARRERGAPLGQGWRRGEGFTFVRIIGDRAYDWRISGWWPSGPPFSGGKHTF